ncbi:hypothetical protein DBB31_27330 [Burkholderia multivorans]|nr:hypothetical protein DBB31_27330 [Burkholderia multivorans]
MRVRCTCCQAICGKTARAGRVRFDEGREEEIAEAALRRFAVDSERNPHLADRTAAECGTLSAHVRANEVLRLV